MKNKLKIVVAILSIITAILIFMVVNMYNNGSKKDVSYSEVLSYDTMLRQPDNYKERPIVFDGLTFQVTESKNSTKVVLDTYKESEVSGNIMYCDVPKSLTKNNRIIEGDVIKIYGVFKKLYPYKTTDGNHYNIPYIKVDKFEIISNSNLYTYEEDYDEYVEKDNNSTEEVSDNDTEDFVETPAETETEMIDNDYFDNLIGEYRYISSSNANIRSGPGFSYPIIANHSKGDLVYIRDIREADERIWCNIGTGWISINTINGAID